MPEQHPTAAVDRIIREAECKELTGLCRSRRAELEKLGKFPRRRKLTNYAIGWRLSEIQEWIDSRQPAQ